MEEFERLLSACFPKWRSGGGKQRRAAAASLFALSRRLRPAVLWDFGAQSLADLSRLAGALRAAFGRSQPRLVDLGSDAFLVDVPELRCWLRRLADNGGESSTIAAAAFVDVSPSLARPTLVDVSYHAAALLQALDAASPQEGGDDDELEDGCRLQLPESPPPSGRAPADGAGSRVLCVPTLYGLVLGYPAVYYSSADDHCLTAAGGGRGGVELTVRELLVDGRTACAFSYPSELTEALRPCVSHWLQAIGDGLEERCSGAHCETTVRRVVADHGLIF